MKNKLIFIVSDVHMQFSYYQETIPSDIDLLIIAGDLLSFGDSEEARFACNFLEALIEDKNISEIIYVSYGKVIKPNFSVYIEKIQYNDKIEKR